MLSLVLAPVAAAAADARAATETTEQKAARLAEEKRLGSLYVRCDGQPNNMPGMETFGRVLALSLVVGLLLPSPEMADPSKRLFGEKGVDACSQLIDGPERREANGLRRVPLLLARGLHRIEAKDYRGAIADVNLARGEAQALGLVGNSYFDRSMGLSFDVIEAEARLRLGDSEGAREVGLRNAVRMPYSFYALVSARNFFAENRRLSKLEEDYYRAYERISPRGADIHISRLQENDRFGEAAELQEAYMEAFEAIDTGSTRSWPSASAAVAYALAGNWELAERRAQQARDNIKVRLAEGKPEDDRAQVTEILDLYGVLKLAQSGKLDEARRNFAARSEWLSPSYGAVMATSTLLRQGAKPEQLFGALAKSADQMFDERRNLFRAQRLELDTNNRSLFTYILPYARIGAFEANSKNVWRTDKPRLISAQTMIESRYHALSISSEAMTQPDVLLLHAAVQAKARGATGFIYFSLPTKPDAAYAWFGTVGNEGFPARFAVDPDAVIAELRQIIPSPEELAARKKAAAKK